MKKPLLIILLLITFLILLYVYFTYFCVFHGKVIDADTKKPIEGAVVVASWSEQQPTPAGPTSRFKDVKEALTDNNGRWLIIGPWGWEPGILPWLYSILTFRYYTTPPEFIVFKPGYCSWPIGFGIEACKGKIKPNGQDKVAGGITVELPRLTNREDRLRNSSIWPSLMESDKESLKKIKNLLKLLNEEDRSLGLSEDPRIRELENEK